VKESPSDPAYGRTNWRRFAVSIGLPLAVAAGLVVLLEQGALAANFQVSGTNFKLSAKHLHGDGFTQYTDALPTATGADGAGLKINAMSGIQSASINNLCQTVAAPSPFGGKVVMRIDAGGGADDKDHNASATDLLIGMSDLQGDTTFTGIQIGVADSSLTKDGVTTPHGSQPSGFGQQADKVDIYGLKQTATFTQAGEFKLTGMKLHLFVGGDSTSHECFPDQ
jgi:Family of unknown function (DUF6230)